MKVITKINDKNCVIRWHTYKKNDQITTTCTVEDEEGDHFCGGTIRSKKGRSLSKRIARERSLTRLLEKLNLEEEIKINIWNDYLKTKNSINGSSTNSNNTKQNSFI